MFYRILASFAALLLVPSLTFADLISLEAFLNLAQEKHPFFRKEALTTDIEQEQQLGFLGTQDWRIKTSPSYSHFEPTGQGLGTPEKEDSTGIETSLVRKFWRSGGQLSLSHRYGFTEQELDDLVIPTPAGNLTVPVGPGQFHENGVSLSYLQPLLRNAAGVLDRLDYALQGYTVEIQTLVSQENQEEFLKALAARFLDWVLLTEQHRIANERLQLANRELKQVRRKFNVGLVDKVDVFRARDAVLSTNASLSRIEAGLNATRSELAALVTDPSLRQKQPDFNPYKRTPLPLEEEAVNEIKEQARVLHALRLQAKQQGALLKGLENAAQPQLDLTLGVGFKGGDESLGDASTFDKTDSRIALDFTYPLGNRSAKSAIRRTKLERRQIIENVHNETVNLEAAVRNVLVQIRGLEATLVLNQQRIKTAKTKTLEEEKRYNRGRTELTFVIQSRDDEALAQLDYAQNAIDYQKQVLEYRALMDTLLPASLSRRDTK